MLEASRAFRRTYRNNRVAFAHDCVDWHGDRPTGYQDEVWGMFDAGAGRVAVWSPRSAGKTCLAAVLTHHFALTSDGDTDWKEPTTASVWRQLRHFLWPEIAKFSRRIRWGKVGRGPYDHKLELQSLVLRLSTGEAFAVASDDPETIEGAHASRLFYCYDEAKIIPDRAFDSSEGSFAGAAGCEALALAISTPGEESGRFYDICSRKAGYEDWKARHVTMDEMLAAGRTTAAFVDQRRRQWGEDSPLFRQQVLGEFCSGRSDGIIRLGWVEAAQERWHALREREVAEGEKAWGDFTCVGVDTARGGSKSVLALRFGDAIRECREMDTRDTMEIVGAVVGVLAKWGGYAVVDVGYNPAVYDLLREKERAGSLGGRVFPFNFGGKAEGKDASGELGFANLRAACYWGMRERLDPALGARAALPPNDLLTGDLTAPTHRTLSGGRILVEAKSEIGERLGRSTDYGDAVCMAYWPVEGGEMEFGKVEYAEEYSITDGMGSYDRSGY